MRTKTTYQEQYVRYHNLRLSQTLTDCLRPSKLPLPYPYKSSQDANHTLRLDRVTDEQQEGAGSRQLSTQREISDQYSSFFAEMELELSRIQSEGVLQLTTAETLLYNLRTSWPVRFLFLLWIRIVSIPQSLRRIFRHKNTDFPYRNVTTVEQKNQYSDNKVHP